MNVYTNISNNIKLLRKNNNYKQLHLAERCKVTPQCISKWEKGLSVPDIFHLTLLSELFNTDLNTLIKTKIKE